MSSKPSDASQTLKNNEPNRVTDSVWFWGAVYCGFGAVVLSIFGYVPLMLDRGATDSSISKNDSRGTETVINSNEEQMTRDDRSNLAARILAPTLGAIAFFSLIMLFRKSRKLAQVSQQDIQRDTNSSNVD